MTARFLARGTITTPEYSGSCVSLGFRDCLYGRKLLFSFALLLKLHSWGYGGLRVLENKRVG